jgi:carbon-monoxide dehydrogenase small subunit
MEVNGEQRTIRCDPGRTLLFLLREKLGLTGAKDGCSSGDCGACVVLVDGRAVNSCMMLAGQSDGTEITTVEGLAGDELHPLQRAFGEHWAFQCGFCTPGMLISCVNLLADNNQPSREEILTAVSGNLCRCTAYQHVVRAVEQAADEMRGSGAADD